MRKLNKILLTICSLAVFTACGEVGEEYLHTNNTIDGISIKPFGNNNAAPVSGVIDDTKDPIEITFPITKALRATYPDLSKLKVAADVGYDAVVTPSLLGIKDLSGDGISVKVTATQTGESKNYTIKAYYSRD